MTRQLTTVERANIRMSGPLALNRYYTDQGNGFEYSSSYPDPPSEVVLSGIHESRTSIGHKGPPFKEGGPFSVRRYTYKCQSMGLSLPDSYLYPRSYGPGNQLTTYSGITTIDPYLLGIHGLTPPTGYEDLKTRHDAISFPAIDLNTYGAQAIDRFSPLKPGSGAGQFFGELNDLPRLPRRYKDRMAYFKRLGSEYVNVEFGWKPFLKDLQDMYHAYQNLNKRMAQIVRDNGLPVRRSGQLLNEISTDTVSFAVDYSVYPQPQAWGADISGTTGTSALTTRTQTRVWFKGRMRYYLPFDTSNEWPLNAKLALFGLNPTPSLLYELMPWSWLIDWFSNLGEVISNLSSNGIADLIIDYGYCMRHSKITTTATFRYPHRFLFNSEGVAGDFGNSYDQLYATSIEETKERVAATPFGFGLQIGDLSVRQLAILTALGLSKQNFI